MDKKEQILSKLPIWEHLSGGEKNIFLDKSYFKTFDTKEVLHSSYQKCFGLIFVESGIVKALLSSKDGKTATLFRIKANDYCVISMSCILSSITFDVEIIAEQPSNILILPIDIFEDISKNNIYVENFTYKKMVERFFNVVSALEQISFLSLHQRIEKYLLDELSYTNSDTLNITHDQLAENISSSREGVSRTLKQMEKNGVLKLNRGSITLINKKSDKQ